MTKVAVGMVTIGTGNDASSSKKHIEGRVAWNPCHREASDAAIEGTPRGRRAMRILDERYSLGHAGTCV